MSELSPQAQAVLDAYNEGFARPVAVHHKPRIAAALRAAADQADPKRNIKDISYQHQLYVDGWKDAIEVILAIADQLEAQ
jgi:hypothetical protein